MNDLAGFVAEGLGEAVRVVIPLVLAGLGGSVVAGWLAVKIGLVDPVATGVLRGLAVLVALSVVADDLAERARGLAVESWSELGAVGRAEP